MDNALLRIAGQAGVPVAHISAFLRAIEDLYAKACAIDGMAQNFKGLLRQMNGPTLVDESVFDARLADSLILKSVELHSPGFWELLGKLNPLTFIRDLLRDIHERKKDAAYRNSAEAEKLALENMLLLNKVVKGQMDLLVKAGVDTNEIRGLLLRQFMPGMNALADLRERGVFDEASLAAAPDDTGAYELDAD